MTREPTPLPEGLPEGTVAVHGPVVICVYDLTIRTERSSETIWSRRVVTSKLLSAQLGPTVGTVRPLDVWWDNGSGWFLAAYEGTVWLEAIGGVEAERRVGVRDEMECFGTIATSGRIAVDGGVPYALVDYLATPIEVWRVSGDETEVVTDQVLIEEVFGEDAQETRVLPEQPLPAGPETMAPEPRQDSPLEHADIAPVREGRTVVSPTDAAERAVDPDGNAEAAAAVSTESPSAAVQEVASEAASPGLLVGVAVVAGAVAAGAGLWFLLRRRRVGRR
jgi:hypothetical protein